MKKKFKKILASLLVAVIVLTAAPLSGFVGLELPDLGEIFSTKAEAATYEVGDLIEFGTYPQTEVTDTSLLSALNSLSLSWISYNYYYGTGGTGSSSVGQLTPGDYMKYADVTYKAERYRAVKFTEYRPYDTGYKTTSGYTYQDDNGYYTNTVYWFKFEPLEWRVLDPDEGFIVCESIIDSQPYNNMVYHSNGEYYQDSSKTNYANDYATSSIRAWLNDDFYHTAFTSEEKSEIKKSVQDNSNSYYPEYGSSTTNDKIFLLSLDEATNSEYGFDSSHSAYDTARRAKGTDYAKVQGLYVYNSPSIEEWHYKSPWWLRSPGSYSYYACEVSMDGICYRSFVNYTGSGIRPALKLNFQSVESPASGAVKFNGHWYKAFEEKKLWNEAKAFCESVGGHLVTITSQEENDFVNSLVKKDGAIIGFTDEINEGNWKWITGEDVIYTNWTSGEPNNQGNEDYALIGPYPYGSWNDGHVDRERWYFICEWDEYTNTPDDFTESIKFGADRFTFGQDMTGVAGDTFDALLVYTSKENDINDLTITSSNPAVATVGTPKIDKGDYITQENERCALLPITLKSAGTATITVTSPTGVSKSITIAVEDKEKSIAVLSTEKSFTVKTGESMWLAFGMMVDGKLIGEWKKMSVTVSDPTLILLSEYEKTEYGYSLEVIGKKEGVTNFTITDSETGISTSIVVSVSDDYNKSYSYAISDIETFYPNNKWEDHIATNIYDLNGIYINNYSCSKSDGKYNVSFNAYNQRYHFGSIDIYDADGNWIGSEAIEKNSDISSLYDTGEQIVYMVLDATTGSWLTYEQATFSEKTTVNIEVPEGGYFTISNNFVESPGSFIYNVSDILINGLTAFFDVSSSLGNLKSLKPADLGKEIMNELLADPNVTEAWMDVFKDVVHYRITETVRDFSTSDIDVVCSEITNIFESSLQRVKVDWKDAVKNCAGLAESAFQKFAGPAGLALEGCFAFANVTNTIMQVRHLAASVDEVYVTIYSSIDEGYINPHGVIVNTNGNMDLEAVLQVFRISDNDAIEIILDNKNPLEKHALYNICFVKNDQQVQPNGKVKVYVPIPEGFVGNTCKVYRQESDGSWTILDATVEGNYLTFETDHFSLYAVVGNRAELKITSLPDKLTYLSNQTIDTTGLVLELNGEKIADGYLCEPSITGNAGTQVVTIRYGVATVDFSVQVVNELPSPEPEEKGKVNSVSINDISMSYKDSATVTPSINADSGVKYTVSYSSSDTDVVSVDSNGRLTTNGTGSATITVTVTDEYGNAVTDTCKVEVSYKWWQWIIVIVLFGWIWY